MRRVLNGLSSLLLPWFYNIFWLGRALDYIACRSVHRSLSTIDTWLRTLRKTWGAWRIFALKFQKCNSGALKWRIESYFLFVAANATAIAQGVPAPKYFDCVFHKLASSILDRTQTVTIDSAPFMDLLIAKGPVPDTLEEEVRNPPDNHSSVKVEFL